MVWWQSTMTATATSHGGSHAERPRKVKGSEGRREAGLPGHVPIHSWASQQWWSIRMGTQLLLQFAAGRPHLSIVLACFGISEGQSQTYDCRRGCLVHRERIR